MVITEPTAWCRGTVAERVRELDQLDIPAGLTVVEPLSGLPPIGREDRTCDRCRVYVPRRLDFWLANVISGRFVLVLGLCTSCARRESPDWVAAR